MTLTGRRNFIKAAAAIPAAVGIAANELNAAGSHGIPLGACSEPVPDCDGGPSDLEYTFISDYKISKCLDWIRYEEQYADTMEKETIERLYFLPVFISQWLGKRRARLYLKYRKPDAEDWQWEIAHFIVNKGKEANSIIGELTSENYGPLFEQFKKMTKR